MEDSDRACTRLPAWKYPSNRVVKVECLANKCVFKQPLGAITESIAILGNGRPIVVIGRSV